jgi:hypothetical protein
MGATVILGCRDAAKAREAQVRLAEIIDRQVLSLTRYQTLI